LKNFDILKTFDIFNAESVRIIRDRIVRFVLVETENFFASKSSIVTELDKDENAQITIVNNAKLYNLLENTWKRHKKKLENESIKL